MTIILHVWQLYYMYDNCTTFMTIVLHLWQLYYIYDNYTTCTTIVLHLWQLYYKAGHHVLRDTWHIVESVVKHQ
jgi:hypothetical protein